MNYKHVSSVREMVEYNPLHPNISMLILHNTLYFFPEVLTRRICSTIKNFFSFLSFSLFSWPLSVIQGSHCKGKFHASHS